MSVVTKPQKPLLGKLRIVSTLTAETGLHIGGSGESLDIGGIDKPVIRDPMTQQPYLPGSSLKGKLRSTLERLLNKPLNRPGGSGTYRYESDDVVDGYSEISNERYVAFEGSATCPVSRLFGSTGNNCWIKTSDAEAAELKDNNSRTTIIENESYTRVKGRNAPARLIVRDCHLIEESVKQLAKIDTGLYMTEWKFENGIDRITAAANPRQLERVPAGAKFTFELVYTVENPEQASDDIKNLAIALAILEDDALGGHGSRGYGKVSFSNFKFYYRGVDQYQQLASGNVDFLQPILELDNTAALLENFGQLTGAVEQRLLPASEAQ
ncbi:type III-A CRISPR-associated RAMP protein Csm3 [Leptolyngbyaceae cyanobacterium CCMR0082]|uniref:CRISPR system Cms endoribonuclease Csm3 n=2 Tax=Adonisia turfae TaxID=2950184 RepID=A0A6M0RZN9_9CYAN|nr:type III-A CRISPR-associated RAMP protein Csm3 [Adonisia turfae]NEZ58581.1 type III-A CRISPR-associated RAMP protein Csm3 [Adonisia turfae CCMR0081]NEZ61182.1 type III-A CRISPR-associated RAMP protein Csm3 [Adonisia turfae CCMR0082]